MLLFCQVVPSLWLTTCWQVVDLQHDNKLLEQTCNKAVEFIKLVTSLLQTCSNLSTSWEQTVRINLATSLFQQACYKSAAGLLQVVRFCVCSSGNFVHMEERTSSQQVVFATSLQQHCKSGGVVATRNKCILTLMWCKLEFNTVRV